MLSWDKEGSQMYMSNDTKGKSLTDAESKVTKKGKFVFNHQFKTRCIFNYGDKRISCMDILHNIYVDIRGSQAIILPSFMSA